MAKQKQQGNDSKMEKLIINSGKGRSASGRKTAAIVVTGVIAVAVVVILFVFLLKPDNKNSVVVQEGDSVLEDLEQKVEEGLFNVKMNTIWTFKDGKSPSSDAYIANSTTNTRSFIFDVILSDTDETVYTSPAIPVGSKLKNLVLDKDLPAGEYKAKVLYHLLNEDGTEYSQTIITIQLHILG